jgi:OPA family glycerol-3-phosphate transporter-like MFS transporter
MLWPPLVRIMAENLGDADYKRASVLVSIAASCGSITVYLIVPACIWLSGWRLSFLLPAGIALLAAGIWIICEPRYEKRMRPQLQREKSSGKSGISLWQVILISGLPPIMLAIVLQGMLRDGITTWMPTYITENYHLQTGSSILTTVLLPVFSIISISVASWLQKKVKSELTASTILFTVAFGSGIVLLLLGQIHAVISILCMTLITGCMHGINMLLISRLPAYFQRFGKVSTISGILNTFTYVGSAASAYGFAALSEQLGWQFTVGLWGVIAGLGALTCFLSIRHWNRFVQQGTEEQ